MAEGIWKVFASLIRFLTAGIAIMISRAATLPFLSTRLKRFWAMTALKPSESVFLICSCWLAGNTSITRSTVFAALLVCRVPKTRCPVDAASIARLIVSRSRISPTRIISGSSLSAPLKAAAKDLV